MKSWLHPFAGRHRLARRLVAFIVATSSVIALAITAAQLWLEYDRDVSDIQSRFQLIEEGYAPSVVQNVWVVDRARLKVLLEGMSTLPDFKFAEVTVDGRPFATAGRRPSDPDLIRRYPLRYEFRGQMQEIGQLEVGASKAGAIARTWERLWFVLILNGLKTALVVAVIVLLVRRMITARLSRIADHARRLAGGDLGTPLSLQARFPSRADDEIQALAADMESMRVGLRQRNDALAEAVAEKEIALLQSRASEAALQESQAHLARAQRLAGMGSWEWEPETGHMNWSAEIFHLLGLRRGETAPSLEGLRQAIPEEDRAVFDAQIQAGREDDARLPVEFRLRGANGALRRVRQQAERMAGSPDRLLGTLQDITDIKRIQEELELAAGVFAHTHDGIMITDPDGVIQSVNKAFTDITGYEPDEAIGQKPRLLQSRQHDPEFYRAMWAELIRSGEWKGEIWNRRKSGEAYLQWTSITTIFDLAGRPKNRICVLSDVTELRRKDERIRHQAYHDALTDLPNRLLLLDRLRHAIDVASRDRETLAVLFVDLDRFKVVNDSLGHVAGDELLKVAAGRLVQCVRASDTVARLGGDEFVAVLSGFGDVGEVARVAEKIVATLDTGFMVGGSEVHVGASIGISMYPADGADAHVLLRNADTAMYASKEGGRGTFRFFDAGMNERAVRRLQTEAGLRRALQQDELELFYQPKWCLEQHRYVGMEALVRWRHPERGLVPPMEFIPIAEETGLIRDIGDWVLDAACRQRRAWLDAGQVEGTVAINVSALQLDNPDFVDQVRATLARHALAAEHVQIEVTESGVMRNPEQAVTILGALRDLGLTIAMDDFGTGYSSFSYLRRLPLHTLKVDRSFVNDIGASAEADGIVVGILNLARSLDMEVVAEGVETDAQAEFLRRHGCPYAQGYRYGKPLPAGEFEALVAASRRD